MTAAGRHPMPRAIRRIFSGLLSGFEFGDACTGMIEDSALLQRYADEQSQDAFSELVRRHIGFVYSASLRRINGDSHRASDVSQVVFIGLARHAHRLSRH